MAEYALQIKPSAQKEMDSLETPVLRRIDAKILGLANDPRPSGSKKLRGFGSYWRVRVGDYRVVYLIDDQKREVVITRVAHRREVYER